jgi:membrane protein required for colicin V production
MNIFDIITALFAIIALLNGWRKGFISQLCSLVGILGGIALAITFNGEVGALFGIDPAYVKPVGFIITFLVTSIAMSFIAKIVGSLFSAIGLGGLDSLLGVALSMLKYALVLSVLFVAVEKFNKEVNFIKPRHFTESKCFKPISALSDKALEMFNTFSQTVKKIE